MRMLLAAAVGVIGITGFVSRPDRSPAPVPADEAVVLVSVDLRCTPNGVNYTVEPWAAHLKQGDSIEWDLDAGASTDEIVIEPKRPGNWPFATRRFRGGRGANNRPHGRGMRPGEQGKRYEYNVLMVCKGPVSRPDTIRVDPEMIIE